MVIDPESLTGLGAAHVADALIKLGLPKRFARLGTKPAFSVDRLIVGRALPVKHLGSVDVFLEAFDRAAPGDVLVADNEGRLDEGCIGDLNVAEAKLAGLAAIVIDGAHRDTAQLREIGLPVWSLGCIPYGPTHMRPERATSAMLGDFVVADEDMIVADEDGVILVGGEKLESVLAAAAEIAQRESKQRAAMANGVSLREQLAFRDYQAARKRNPGYTFREHVNKMRGAVET